MKQAEYMELYLKKASSDKISVSCNGQLSHSFTLKELPSDPIESGKILFDGLFRKDTPSHMAWVACPKRILLVTESDELDSISWEYMYGPDGFIVLDVSFVRGLPADKRQSVPDLKGVPLHIVAVPSNPIANEIARLDIEGEWSRLKESLHGLEANITLERVRPPTLDQARRLLANKRNRVLHFMGHGVHVNTDSFLFFEDEHGAPKGVNAKEFVRRIEDSAYLVTLNACVSATPGATEFCNIARALAKRGVPYALGMRLSIPDTDAKSFSRTFYDELSRGSSVENALRQTRNTLAESKNPWALGTPVLYTSLNGESKGFETVPGSPCFDEHQPPLEVFVLPRAEGIFRGRVDELLVIGQALTDEPRPKLITIHGSGGQGKTALAREAAERFAFAWPGGVWAVSLENSHELNRFTLELANLFKINLESIYQQVALVFSNLETTAFQEQVQQELERRILSFLSTKRALLILDNAETFVEAVEAKNKAAIDLAAFLREKVLSTQASLLVTSRDHLGWTGEKLFELGGLSANEGARLFWQSAPKRGMEAIGPLAQEISRKVEGHPLSLRLLGGAFDATAITLDDFVYQVEDSLLQAKDKYKNEDHRHRTLYASIATSVRYMNQTDKVLLSGLWIFQSPFLAETAAQIFGPAGLPVAKNEAYQSQITEQLQMLCRRGLLLYETETLSDSVILLYRTLPTVRLFLRHYLEQVQSVKSLEAKMGKTYYDLLLSIDRQLDHMSWTSYLARHCREDLEISAGRVKSEVQGWYNNRLGRVLARIGDWQAGLRLLQEALAKAQGEDQDLEAHILNNIANVYHVMGHESEALELFNQALLIIRQVGNTGSEASTLGNMANVYRVMGQPGKAIELYEQALPMKRAVGDRKGEAALLSNMANVYNIVGQPGTALKLYGYALAIIDDLNDRAGKSSVLNNMANVYIDHGKLSEALKKCEQALPLTREIGDLQAEAVTLNNLGEIYHATGELGKAIEFYEQALVIHRHVGNRLEESNTLSNMGTVYGSLHQPEKSMQFLEQALSLTRELGYRLGEATTLHNIAITLSDSDQLDRALEILELVLPIRREVSDKVGEASTLRNMAILAYDMEQAQRAITLLRQAVELKKQLHYHNYEQDKALLAKWESNLRRGVPMLKAEWSKDKIDSQQLQTVISNTVSVMTNNKGDRTAWQKRVTMLRNDCTSDEQSKKDFFEAILVILYGQKPSLDKNHPYEKVIKKIIRQIYKPKGFFDWLKKFEK